MKDFLVITNKNAVTYKEIFPLIKDRILSLGYTIPKDYDQPEEYEYKSLQGLTRWITTLSVTNKPPLVLTATYDPERHRKYDNYDAINVDTIKDIPYDYPGVMGVPITVLGKNLDDVEIVGGYGYSRDTDGKAWNAKINGNYIYKRILIQLEGLLYGEYTDIDGEYIKGHRPLLDGKQKYTRALIRTKDMIK